MKLVIWMTAASIAGWAVASVLAGRDASVAILLGMLGPLIVVSVTWVLAERTFRTRPERFTALMIASFAGKMLFFAAYIATMLSLLSLRPVPFVVSFTSYFIALYLVEAVGLSRLFARTSSVGR